MIRHAIIFAAVVGAFVLGMYVDIAATSEFAVLRHNGVCVAYDTFRGKELGTFPIRSGRCWFADWRLRSWLG